MHIANFQFTFRDHGEFEIRNLANFLDRIFKVRTYNTIHGISYWSNRTFRCKIEIT